MTEQAISPSVTAQAINPSVTTLAITPSVTAQSVTTQVISPLRQRMIEDMAIRKFTAKTQHDYVQRVKDFATFPGRSPRTAESEDVRRFRLHLASCGAGTPTINATCAALRFFFKVTLDRPDLAKHLTFVHEPRKVPVVLSPEEVARFLEAAPGSAQCRLRCRAAGFRGRFAQGIRYRLPTHDAARRAGQGPQGSPRHAVPGAARTAARLVSPGAAAGLSLSKPGYSPARTPSPRCRHVS